MSRALKLALLGALVIAGALPSAPSDTRASEIFDGTWSSLDPNATAPGARREYTAVYDHENHRYVIFGGADYRAPDGASLHLEVFALTLGLNPTWSELAVAPGPGPRHSPQWGYDRANHRMIMFGGYGRRYPNSPLAYLNDVWQLSLDGPVPTWTELFPTGTAPTGRLAGASVYDPFRQRFVGFGGTVGQPTDTWVLDLSDVTPHWGSAHPDSSEGNSGPPGGYGMVSIFDPVRDRMLIFGGSTSDAYYGCHNELWELRLRTQDPVWHHLQPDGTRPIARRSGTAIYDPLRYRMVIYGGWDGEPSTDAFLDDAWALSLLDPPLVDTWQQLSPGGTIPTQRDAMSAVYDPLGDRMVVFGGWSGQTMLGDTQFLDWSGLGSEASMTASSHASAAVAQITWDVDGATGVNAAVYRREEGGAMWSSIATVEADGAGTVTFADYTVQPGHRYGYMVVVPSEVGTDFGGEEWVDVPSTTGVGSSSVGLALNQVRPNPVIERFTASFTLPNASPARLELIDLSGRRVLSREVGAMGAGTHHLQIAGAREFSPGMYFLRLTQSGKSASSRVVIQGH